MCAKSHVRHIHALSGLYIQLQGALIVIRLVFLGYSIDVASSFWWVVIVTIENCGYIMDQHNEDLLDSTTTPFYLFAHLFDY